MRTLHSLARRRSRAAGRPRSIHAIARPCAAPIVPWLLVAFLLTGCASRPCPGPSATGPRTPPLAAPRILGEKPLCEASGAAFVPCEDGGGRCLLVADNENESALFLFDIAGDTLANQRAVPLRAPRGSAAIADAEGLATVGGRIFVVGSHSRRSWNKRPPACTLDERRLAFGLFDWSGGALTGTPVRTSPSEWRRLLQTDGCRHELIASRDADLVGRLCATIAAGQADAEHSREGCAQGINVEGVAVLPGGGDPRVWLGLRGPLLDGRAVLLRLATLEALRFDAAVTLELHGDGVRDLTVAGDRLWILAGPPADDLRAGTLWHLPLDRLADGAVLSPALAVAGLPPFAEAIAIDPATGSGFALIDGDEEKGPGHPNGCPQPARYVPLALPR